MSRRGSIALLAAASVAAFMDRARAQAAHPVESAEPAYPGPPLGIDDAATVEPGHLELNLTAGFGVARRTWVGELPLADANFGLFDGVHVNAEIAPVLAREDGERHAGLGNPGFGVKVRIVNAKGVGLALHPALELGPLPAVAAADHGSPILTLPVVLDLALGESGVGLGLQLSRSLARDSTDAGWAAAIGLAGPLGAHGVLMGDYVHAADLHLGMRSGWFELSYLHSPLFGSERWTLLTSLAHALDDQAAALVGARLGL